MKVYNFTLNVITSADFYLLQTDSDLVGQSEPAILRRESLEALAEISFNYDMAQVGEAVGLGQHIYRELLPEAARTQFERARTLAEEQSAVLRLLLKFGSAPLLQKIPWELMHDGHRALALDPLTPIVRYVEQPSPVKDLRIEPPVRVLFTTACPPKVEPLDLAAEEKLFRRALKPFDASIQLEVRRNVSLSQLRHIFFRAQERDLPFHIWHHCGHGAHADDQFALVLEEGGQAQYAYTREITAIVGKCPSLRLAVLDVCYGAALGGLAPSLAAINVPATIGFRDRIYDRVALDFTQTLYGNLLRQPVDLALKQAIRALFDPIRPLDWALPLLFLRTTNASFFAA